jgi:hypothetical protein
MLNGLLNQIQRTVIIASMVGNEAKQMQRIRVIWLNAKNVFIYPFGQLKPAGLMILDRLAKFSLDIKYVFVYRHM